MHALNRLLPQGFKLEAVDDLDHFSELLKLESNKQKLKKVSLSALLAAQVNIKVHPSLEASKEFLLIVSFYS